MFKVVLCLVLCVVAQNLAAVAVRPNDSNPSDVDDASHLPPIALQGIHCVNYSAESVAQDIDYPPIQLFPTVHLEAIIDGYLPVEFVENPIDDAQSFGELTVSEHDANSPSHESVVSDLVDRCKALLKTIKDYIVSKVRGVINTVSTAEVHAKVLIDSGTSSFKRKLDQVIQKARDGIKRKVAELKKDVGQCLNESEKQFKDLIKSFILSEARCVTDEFHKAFDIAKNTKNTILAAIRRIEILPGEISTCLKGNDKFNCVKKDVWDVAKTEEQHFKNFVFQFGSVASFVTGFESRVASCALDQLGKAGQSSLNIVEKFPVCVLNKVIK